MDDTRYPNPEIKTERLRSDARSLFSIGWSDIKIARHVILNNGDLTYGRYLTEEAVLAVVTALLAEMNAEQREADRIFCEAIKQVSRDFPGLQISK